MTTQILNDFHGDGVFRDQQGTIWVRQSELVAGMARAWDEGYEAHQRVTFDGESSPENPYRARGE